MAIQNMEELNKIQPNNNSLPELDVLGSDFSSGRIPGQLKREPVVRIKGVHKEFFLGASNIHILKGIEVEILRGEFVMLMGPSGCGKSTLLHIVYGLEQPTQGTVFIEDEDVWAHTKAWRAHFRNQYIGFIPQQAFWIKSLSVIENVAIPGFIGGRSYKESVERAYRALEVVGMHEWAHYRPFDLSGGQQQKVAFARSLLLNPKFIIADEPTGNLDQKSGVQLMDLIKSFNEKFNITVLMVTHNPDQLQYATKVVKMVDGVVANDTNDQNEITSIKNDA